LPHGMCFVGVDAQCHPFIKSFKLCK
jgi:hypothetical protein